jgi:hypothetical protein
VVHEHKEAGDIADIVTDLQGMVKVAVEMDLRKQGLVQERIEGYERVPVREQLG